jgi:UDP-glucose 4-epimerase
MTWEGRRVVVTGANGFVGAHLVDHLVRLGASVTALVRPHSNTWRLASVAQRVHLVRAELDDPSLDRVVNSAEMFYHLAASGTNQADHNAYPMLQSNVLGSYNALELAARLGAKRMICAGTGLEYGPRLAATEESTLRPITAYAATKAAASLVIHACARRMGVTVVTLRMYSVYGPAQARHFVVPYTVTRALAGEPIELTGGMQLRDYVYIDDVVQAYVRSGDAAIPEAEGSAFYNVASGAQLPVRDLVTTIVSLARSTSAVKFGARPYSPTEMWESSGSIAKAERELGWRPQVALSDGLQRTITWFAEHRELYDVHCPPVPRAG